MNVYLLFIVIHVTLVSVINIRVEIKISFRSKPFQIDSLCLNNINNMKKKR